MKWENQVRIQNLTKFREDVSRYFEHAPYDWQVGGRIEDDLAIQLRTTINEDLALILHIIVNAGISPVIHWTPPATIDQVLIFL